MVKVYIYSPDILLAQETLTLITPRYWNSFSLISVGRMQCIFCCCTHSHSTNFCFTWYPYYCCVARGSLDPKLRESNPRPIDLGVQHLKHLARRFTSAYTHFISNNSHMSRKYSYRKCACTRYKPYTSL